MIECDHCGTAINVEKNSRCPNCGASYARNKDYKEYKENNRKDKEYNFREREADIKTKEISNEMLSKQQDLTNNVFKASKTIFIVAGVIFAIIFITAIVFIFFVGKKLF